MSDSKLKSLMEIFNRQFFRIPDFQRGYSWEKRHLDDFWEDIENLKRGKIHYTGLLTLQPIHKEDIISNDSWEDDLWLFKKGFSAYYIIDGQQRLTTSIILINELLKKFSDDDDINFETKQNWRDRFLFQNYSAGTNYKSYIFGYEKDNPSDEYFKTKVLDQTSVAAGLVAENTLYTANLKAAKSFFHKKIKDLSIDEIKEVLTKLTSHFKFNEYKIDDELDVYVTFETMNNRGKSLSNLELLKNRLIYITTLLSIDDVEKMRLRKDINNSWKTIYEYLGKNEKNRMSDDEFLHNHWIMFFGNYNRKESASYAKFLLGKHFTSKKASSGGLSTEEVKTYVDSLAKSVKSWFELHNPANIEDVDIKEWLYKLNRLGFGAFKPLIMASMVKEEIDVGLLKSAEKFIFLVFKVSQKKSNSRNSHFYRKANEYYSGGNMTISSVAKDINFNIDGETGEGEGYDYHGMFELSNFETFIEKQNENGAKKEGFYNWNGLRYFLFEYELYLQDEANGNAKISWESLNRRKKEDTIEHIYPQTPKDKSWKTTFNKYDKKQKNILLHSLGNLVLLSRSKNAKLSNRKFDQKKKRIDSSDHEVGFFNGSYSEIEVSGYANWSPQEICERGEEMLTFMEERWGFCFAEWYKHISAAGKREFLGLSFVNNELGK